MGARNTPPPPPRPLRELVRSSARLVGILALGYVGILIVLLFLENWFIFRPASPQDFWEEPQDGQVQDVWLTSGDGTKLHAWWHPVPDARWVVLYCHGNAGNVSLWSRGAREWNTQVGASVLLFDYPGYGKSDGSPSEAGCYAAAEEAYRWLVDEEKTPPNRIIIHGVSLGGAVAVELAMRKPHAALSTLCAFTSLPDMAQRSFPWLPARWLVRTQFDSLAKIAEYRGPLLIAHGDADELVPFEHGQRLFAAAASVEKEFFAVPGGQHETSATPGYYAAVRSFLARVAGSAGE